MLSSSLVREQENLRRDRVDLSAVARQGGDAVIGAGRPCVRSQAFADGAKHLGLSLFDGDGFLQYRTVGAGQGEVHDITGAGAEGESPQNEAGRGDG